MGANPAARAGRHGDVVVEPAAESLAQGSGWAAPGQHLYDLAHAARGRPELAEEPHLVRNRHRHAWVFRRSRPGVPILKPAMRTRKHGVVRVSDPDAAVKRARSAKFAVC